MFRQIARAFALIGIAPRLRDERRRDAMPRVRPRAVSIDRSATPPLVHAIGRTATAMRAAGAESVPDRAPPSAARPGSSGGAGSASTQAALRRSAAVTGPRPRQPASGLSLPAGVAYAPDLARDSR